MEKIIKLWLSFKRDWEKDITNHAERLDGTMGILKPHFSDFMDWLSARKVPTIKKTINI